MLSKIQPCTGTSRPHGTVAPISKKSQTPSLAFKPPPPTQPPATPEPSLACPLKFISSLVLQLGWLSPFLLLSHPWAHRSEPPRISPGPHAQVTDVDTKAQRSWLPWCITHVTGRGGGWESCLQAVPQLATSTLHAPWGLLVCL